MDEFPSEELWMALEERQNELILRLDDLNRQIEIALAELEGEGLPVAPQRAA